MFASAAPGQTKGFFAFLASIPKIPVLALVCLVFTGVYLMKNQKPDPVSAPYRTPSQSPYAESIAGVGLLEAQDLNLEMSPARTDRMVALYVKEGQQVKAGQALYKLDTAALEAQLAIEQAELRLAEQELERLRHMPDTRDITPLRWQVKEAEATQKRIAASLKRLDKARGLDAAAVSEEEYQTLQFQLQEVVARRQRLQAEQDKLVTGSWEQDIRVSEAKVMASKARLTSTLTALDRSTVRASRAGEVLQISQRPGEIIASTQTTPPLVLGRTKTLYVRVDIDENSAPLVRPNMSAVAYLKGDSTHPMKQLKFIRIEPYMVPKKSLTGMNTERVDVRVLQLVYELTPPKDMTLYVGQQVDVYLLRHKDTLRLKSGIRPEDASSVETSTEPSVHTGSSKPPVVAQ
jgi:HlyD family secretion protein